MYRSQLRCTTRVQSSSWRKRMKKSAGGAATSTFMSRPATPHSAASFARTSSGEIGGRRPATVATNARPVHFRSRLSMPRVGVRTQRPCCGLSSGSPFRQSSKGNFRRLFIGGGGGLDLGSRGGVGILLLFFSSTTKERRIRVLFYYMSICKLTPLPRPRWICCHSVQSVSIRVAKYV